MTQRGQGSVRVAEDVGAALAAGRPVVALETSIVAHGLPKPANLEVGRAMSAAVTTAGATAATTAVVAGVPRVGLADDELATFAEDAAVAKASGRDLARLAALGGSGATTVAGTLMLAGAVGIEVMATGGIGGVHRGAAQSFDVSADLEALARSRAVVVCAGAKSLLDLPGTLEWLESRGVPVVGWATTRLPAFHVADSGLVVPAIDDVATLAELVRTHWELGGGGVLVARPPPVPLDPEAVERWTAQAHLSARRAGIGGAALTPFLLAEMARLSEGLTVAANRELVLANATLAARLATSLEAKGGDGYSSSAP